MLSKISIKRPVTTIMVILMVFLAGLVAYSNLELAYMPSTDMPMAVISTSYLGTGPEEMEELVTKPIEETMATLTGVENITSTSSVGSSMVMLEFTDGTDLDDKTNEIRDKLDRVKGSLPDGADEPSIMKMDMNADNIMVGITSSVYDTESLYNLLEQNISSRFERVEGISAVSMMGGVEKEIQIVVSPEKMKGYGITTSTISTALARENTNLPAGEVLQGETDLQLRAIGEFESIQDIENLPITTSNGNVIHIKDVATIKEVEKDQEQLALLNGYEGIMFSLSKQSDANIVSVCDNLNQTIAQLSTEYPELNIELLTTTADYIKTSINNVIETAFQSAIIAIFVLLIFLRDPKTSLVIGISIPTSIMATFALMYVCGMTMNTISMGGIVIGIGMLVDNSVVVLENIYTYWKKGVEPKEAAQFGASEVAMAVTASTLTSIAVFGPLIFVSGMIGAMLKELAMTICFALVASLVVSLTFVPMACSRLLSREMTKVQKKKNLFTYIGSVWLYGLESLDRAYQKVLGLALKHRVKTVIIVIVCFIASLSVIPFMGMDLMSSTDEGTLSISINMPDGTIYEKTEDALMQVLEQVDGIPEKETVFAMVRGSASASININLCDKQERDRSTDDIVQEIKQQVKEIPGAEINVSASSSAMGSMGGGSDLSLKITGEETDTLKEIGNDLIALFEEIDGTQDFESSLDESITEGNIKLNREKAAKYGISTTDVANLIRNAVNGSTASTYKDDGDEIDIVIQYDEDTVKYANDIKNLTITTAAGITIPVTEVADIVMGDSAVSINRENQQRYITVSGSFQGMDTSTAQSMVQEKLDSYIFPDNYNYEFGGTMNMMNESFSSLTIVIIVAILLVYMIMASQFESVLYPFIVMFSMPLAITGGIIGLFITGQSITVTALMGFIMLIGMVVNNAIVLVDCTNQLIETKNLKCDEALLEAGPARLRPILMTVLTTVIGLLPMALATSSGMETQQPLGITVIFGLSISTLVTLLFIPVLYSLINSGKERFAILKANIKSRFAKPDITEQS